MKRKLRLGLGCSLFILLGSCDGVKDQQRSILRDRSENSFYTRCMNMTGKSTQTSYEHNIAAALRALDVIDLRDHMELPIQDCELAADRLSEVTELDLSGENLTSISFIYGAQKLEKLNIANNDKLKDEYIELGSIRKHKQKIDAILSTLEGETGKLGQIYLDAIQKFLEDGNEENSDALKRKIYAVSYKTPLKESLIKLRNEGITIDGEVVRELNYFKLSQLVYKFREETDDFKMLGSQSLAALKYLKKLSVLKMSDNKNIYFINSLYDLPNLQILDVTDSGVGSRSLNELVTEQAKAKGHLKRIHTKQAEGLNLVKIGDRDVEVEEQPLGW